MRIGIFTGDMGDGSVAAITRAARAARDDGFASYWLPQIFGVEAITALAVAGTAVDGIELGTAVVPTYPRHPSMLAQLALTASGATQGRFALGIGLSHQMVIEGMYGISFAKPVRHLREYLDILVPLLGGASVQAKGETLSFNGAVAVPGAPRPPVLVAALGPQLLELTGRAADGTITWCVGAQTLAAHTVPVLTRAAEAAGRPAPRVVCGLPVCVTDDVEAAKKRMARAFAIYPTLPSYRAMLDREGAEGPADIALVGTEQQVLDGLAGLRAAGATDFAASIVAPTPDDKARTIATLQRGVRELA